MLIELRGKLRFSCHYEIIIRNMHAENIYFFYLYGFNYCSPTTTGTNLYLINQFWLVVDFSHQIVVRQVFLQIENLNHKFSPPC
jgi:hypothetical protein